MPVRWYTVNTSLKSIRPYTTAINNTLIELGAVRLAITPAEQLLIDELITQLDELEHFSRTCTQDRVLDSNFLLSLIKLNKFFRAQCDAEFTFNSIKDFRRRFRANVDRRIVVTKEHVLAFLLDPQTKDSALIKEYVSKFTNDGRASSFLCNEINALKEQHPTDSNVQPANFEVGSRKEDLERLEAEENIAQQTDSNLLSEVQTYLGSARVALEPSEYWARRSDSSLYSLFLSVGCIQLSSNKSEQTWSRSSLLNTKKRSKLLSSNLCSALYINVNYNICSELEFKENVELATAYESNL